MTTTTATVEQGVFVSPAEFAMTSAKVAKINARAERKGFTGRLVLTSEPAERTYNHNGFSITEHGFRVLLGGEAPSYNGARLLAALDIEEGGFIVRTAPGVESIDRSTLRPGYCDHCKTNRPRNRTFVVEAADGTQVQVGSTCIKDYLGWDTTISFISTEEAERELDFGGFGGGERTYDVDSVLAVAWAATSTLGFVPSQSYDGLPTRKIVAMVLGTPTAHEQKVHEAEILAVAAKAQGSAERAAEVKAFILSDEFSGSGEYVQNLKVLCSGSTVKDSNLGFLASAPQAHLRYLGQQAERKAEAEVTVNEHVGQVKDKVEVNVTIVGIRYIDGAYGMTTLYTFRADTGHTYKWFSSAGITNLRPTGRFGYDGTEIYDYVEAEVGETLRIKGTIKDHDEYQGRKATVLTRCKEVL
jgi:hypothetical protein